MYILCNICSIYVMYIYYIMYVYYIYIIVVLYIYNQCHHYSSDGMGAEVRNYC